MFVLEKKSKIDNLRFHFKKLEKKIKVKPKEIEEDSNKDKK